MIYAKGGYANLELGVGGLDAGTRDGWRVGGGAEWARGGSGPVRPYLKAEYRYSEFFDSLLSRHQFVGSASLRF